MFKLYLAARLNFKPMLLYTCLVAFIVGLEQQENQGGIGRMKENMIKEGKKKKIKQCSRQTSPTLDILMRLPGVAATKHAIPQNSQALTEERARQGACPGVRRGP